MNRIVFVDARAAVDGATRASGLPTGKASMLAAGRSVMLLGPRENPDVSLTRSGAKEIEPAGCVLTSRNAPAERSPRSPPAPAGTPSKSPSLSPDVSAGSVSGSRESSLNGERERFSVRLAEQDSRTTGDGPPTVRRQSPKPAAATGEACVSSAAANTAIAATRIHTPPWACGFRRRRHCGRISGQILLRNTECGRTRRLHGWNRTDNETTGAGTPRHGTSEGEARYESESRRICPRNSLPDSDAKTAVLSERDPVVPPALLRRGGTQPRHVHVVASGYGDDHPPALRRRSNPRLQPVGLVAERPMDAGRRHPGLEHGVHRRHRGDGGTSRHCERLVGDRRRHAVGGGSLFVAVVVARAGRRIARDHFGGAGCSDSASLSLQRRRPGVVCLVPSLS